MSDSHRSKDYFYSHLLFIICLLNYNEKLSKKIPSIYNSSYTKNNLPQRSHHTTPTLADFHTILSKLFNQTIKHEKL